MNGEGGDAAVAPGPVPGSRSPVLVGAGLKMYLGHRETSAWLSAVGELATRHPGTRSGQVELVVLPGFTSLAEAVRVTSPSGVRVGAQDLFWEDTGPYTGEVSGRELAELGCRYVEVGHAERRRLFGENDDVVAAKTTAAWRHRLTPIICVGEPTPGDADLAADVCLAQFLAAVEPGRRGGAVGRAVVAYEPVWAIGATAAAGAAHIRTVCARLGSALDVVAQGSRVVYGGSAGPGLLDQLGPTVDGLFMGRSSHDPRQLERVLDEAVRAARHPPDLEGAAT